MTAGASGAVRALATASALALAVLVVPGPAHPDPAPPSPGHADPTPPSPGAPAALDLLLLGDSITLGRGAPPGFRADLARRLAELLPAPFAQRIAFVGSAGEAPRRGHFRNGARAVDFYPPGFGTGRGNGTFDVAADLALARGRGVIAIHLGTNDLNVAPPYVPYSLDHGRTLAGTRSAELAELLRYVVARREGVSPPIVLSLIIPAGGRGQDVADWNEAAIAMAEDFAEGVPAGRPVRIAIADHAVRFKANPDLFTFGRGDWMHDGLHPNAAGYAEMARVYAAAIAAAVADTIPPAAVTDLAAAAIGMDRVALALTATGDDGNEARAARYDLRVAASPITAENFADAVQICGEPAPAAARDRDTLRVRGLTPGRNYFFALKVADEGGNRSFLSNGIAVATADRGRTVVSFRNGVDGYAGMADATIANRPPRAHESASGTLSIGATRQAERPVDVNRAHIRFELESIPGGARVHAARLRIYCYAIGASGPVRIIAHRGKELGGEPIAAAELSSAGAWCEWDLTAAVQAWVAGTWENHGLLLATADETTTNCSWFWSAEYPDDAYLRPGLRVDYSLAGEAAPAASTGTTGTIR